ncbi:hypothetical protein ACFLZ3_00510 [Candidatus Omnitrophota bacterium]
MNKKQLIVALMVLATYLFLTPASAYQGGCPIGEGDYGRTLVAYFKDIDLNNDGKPESVKVIDYCRFSTNIEDDWGDDTGAVVKIFDSQGKEIYWDALPNFQNVETVDVEDINGDGFREVVIKMEGTEEYPETDLVYCWEFGEYKCNYTFIRLPSLTDAQQEIVNRIIVEDDLRSYEARELDLDGDGASEVAITYAAGVHSSGAKVIKFKDSHEVIFEHGSGTPNTRLETIDGKAAFVFEESDYKPNYNTGKRYEEIYRWDGEKFSKIE